MPGVFFNRTNGQGLMVSWAQIHDRAQSFINEKGQQVCRECAQAHADEVTVMADGTVDGRCEMCGKTLEVNQWGQQ